MDHGPTLDVTACGRTFDKPVDGVWASDHFGVVSDLAIPGPGPMAHDQRNGRAAACRRAHILAIIHPSAWKVTVTGVYIHDTA